MRKFKLKPSVAEKMKTLGGSDSVLPDAQSSDSAPEAAVKNASGACEIPGTAKHSGQPGSAGLAVAWRTDVGKVRKSNQDAVILCGTLFGIADGMGGHNGGETAAFGLRDGLVRELQEAKPDRKTLLAAVQKVNEELYDRSVREAALSGMGTTLTALWVDHDSVLLAQVGDSRAYLLRDCTFRQVTEDHSMVADMVRRGILTEDQAACHPMRNYITRAIGTDEEVETDLSSLPRQKGDRWLICSDGLYGMMSRLTLETISSIPSIEEAADHLCREALENGGRDNISFILIDDLTGGESEDSDPDDSQALLNPDGEKDSVLPAEDETSPSAAGSPAKDPQQDSGAGSATHASQDDFSPSAGEHDGGAKS